MSSSTISNWETNFIYVQLTGRSRLFRKEPIQFNADGSFRIKFYWIDSKDTYSTFNRVFMPINDTDVPMVINVKDDGEEQIFCPTNWAYLEPETNWKDILNSLTLDSRELFKEEPPKIKIKNSMFEEWEILLSVNAIESNNKTLNFDWLNGRLNNKMVLSLTEDGDLVATPIKISLPNKEEEEEEEEEKESSWIPKKFSSWPFEKKKEEEEKEEEKKERGRRKRRKMGFQEIEGSYLRLSCNPQEI